MVPDRHPTAAMEYYRSDISYQEIPGNPHAELSGELLAKILDIYSRYKNKTLNYYEILCVDGFAGRREIRKAYYTKVREFHPDRYSQLSSDMKEKLNDLLSYLNEAYEVLTNCQDRFEYNRSRVYHQPLNVSNIDLARREFEKGKLEFWNGCMPEAGKCFQNAIYLDNTPARYFFFHAKTLQNLGNLREAEKAIRNALKIDPANPDYLVEAGKIYYGLGLTYRAREKFEMALRIQPSNTKARQGVNDLGNKKKC
jgi:curved DNA-binding protein CbpA